LKQDSLFTGQRLQINESIELTVQSPGVLSGAETVTPDQEKAAGREVGRASIRYGSVCSGIEAASCAWHPLGWVPRWFAEIDPFPSAVLVHRWPSVPNLGDFTKIGVDVAPPPIDLLVGGTPCQSFSVAGLRGGLADDRGNLALEFLRLAARVRARWLVWENVPGVLSSNEGRDFGSILGGLVELGYGFAYRILDAQFFGVPQRRRRIFVVGYLGDWRPAAAVLFERASLRGDPPPSRKAREDVAGPLGSSSPGGSGWRGDVETNGAYIPQAFGGNRTSGPLDVATAVRAHGGTGHGDFESETFIAHALRGEGFDASEDGTGRGTPLVPVAVRTSQTSANGHGVSEDVAHTLDSIKGQAVLAQAFRAHMGGAPSNAMNLTDQAPTLDHHAPAVLAFDTTQITSPENRCQPEPGDPCHPLAAGAHPPAIAFQERGREDGRNLEFQTEVAYSLNAPSGGGRSQENNVLAPVAFQQKASSTNSMNPSETAPTLDRCKADGMSTFAAGGVRRLTPRECERLQGFADDWTLVPYHGKPAADGPRYKAIGNSMAVVVMAWIGRRIEAVERVLVGLNEKQSSEVG
jgi:DNA (cytosine-5)-methyltransferase 1